jgi:hypothetical protein
MIEIRNERLNKIPFEVVGPDGSIYKNASQVFDKWAHDFSGILNTNDENDPSYVMPLIDVNLSAMDVDDEIISIAEIYQAILRAKSGK